MASLVDSHSEHLHSNTQAAIAREQAKQQTRQKPLEARVADHWKGAARLARRWARSRLHYQDKLNVCTTEHMSPVDVYDGKNARQGKSSVLKPQVFEEEEDLLLVSPEIDGRLKDEGRD